MRSPSTAAQSGMRGRLPVDSRMASASISVTPSAVSTAISWAPLSRAVPWIMRTPWLRSSSTMLSSSRVSMSLMRLRTPSRSSRALALARPIPSLVSTNPMRPAVAIMAFDGMQSCRWAAPPTTSRSIIVTSAPSRAAVVAAVLPAGPPPMITKRRGMPTGYGRRPPASPPASTLGSGQAHQAVVGGEQPAGQPQADDHDVGADAAEDEVHDRRLHPGLAQREAGLDLGPAVGELAEDAAGGDHHAANGVADHHAGDRHDRPADVGVDAEAEHHEQADRRGRRDRHEGEAGEAGDLACAPAHRDGGKAHHPPHPQPRPNHRGVLVDDEHQEIAHGEQLDDRAAAGPEHLALEPQALPDRQAHGHGNEDERQRQARPPDRGI